MSGRDRQKSASYYTPEVLTQCTVKYTLKSILEKVEQGEMSSLELLDLKLLEPAMGAAAFHNELINQLSEAYLNYRQKEVKKKISPEKYREELQRVKAYIATNNTYGVDLNPTAIELGKLSLWLNVIHKDMETPFFANRLAVGNAVVGAWFKTFTTKELKKKWWECEPQMISFENGKINRSKNQIYHFLLPDKNMVPSAGIKLLKEEDPDRSKRVTDWKKEVCKPITETEIQQLQKICESVDSMVLEYFEFQKKLNLQTKNKLDVWQGVNSDEQVTLNLRSYDEKEQLNDQRNRQSAPYYKLKMVMDYWCSLWFWDMRNAEFLPTRQQYLNDISSILNVNLSSDQLGFGFEESTLGVAQSQIIKKTEQSDLFDEKERLSLVKDLSNQNRFFHTQLEFIEVFLERGGFDVIVGNPPWVKIQFEEKYVISERYPEVITRGLPSPKIRNLVNHFLQDYRVRSLFIQENVELESLSCFITSEQNYFDLKGTQSNLYKSITVNSIKLSSRNGVIGLITPEGIYEDPKGLQIRKEIYPRLIFHFQFINEISLFKEVHHSTSFGIQVYSGEKNNIDFISLSNLFHPSTIDGSFNIKVNGPLGGIKELDKKSGKLIWNTIPHQNRVIRYTEEELRIIVKTFENSEDWEGGRLVGLQGKDLLNVISKLGGGKTTLSDFNHKITKCWDQTNDDKKGIITKCNKKPNNNGYEKIYSGPHFSILNPYYKTPRSTCLKSSDYDIIDLNKGVSSSDSRTLYIPNEDISVFKKRIVGVGGKSWIDDYKLGFTEMLGSNSERTLQPFLMPPKSSHLNTVVSVQFENHITLLKFAFITSSVTLDFLVKSMGRGHLIFDMIRNFPLVEGNEGIYNEGIVRLLRLNCLTNEYSGIWSHFFNQPWIMKWSYEDHRLDSEITINHDWERKYSIQNSYARRIALIEIDVLVAILFGMTLGELITTYKIQFPVLQQNEEDTWYDQKGNILFTCSKGLTGVGVDRPVWNSINDLKDGETYEHTIEKSELYRGEKVTYYAPFEKCDRVEDYKVAWAHFEKIFNQN